MLTAATSKTTSHVTVASERDGPSIAERVVPIATSSQVPDHSRTAPGAAADAFGGRALSVRMRDVLESGETENGSGMPLYSGYERSG